MIPTAKELIFKVLNNVQCDNEIEYLSTTKDGNELLAELENEISNFVNFHVVSAKIEILSKLQIVDLKEYGSYNHIEKETIKNAYPSTNIK